MRKLVVLTGVGGAGKTTMSEWLEAEGRAWRLKPFTTRAKRSPQDDEYHFLTRKPTPAKAAWIIDRGDKYGMLKSEIDGIPENGIAVTVFDPEQLATLETYRSSSHDVEIIVVGLDTIASESDQHARVNNDPKRIVDAARLKSIRDTLAGCDVRLEGSESVVRAALVAICRIISGRGGMVAGPDLKALIQAKTLLTDVDDSRIQTSSYDLTAGSEMWCQGSFIDLTASNDRFSIPPYSYVIVKARELASLPSFLAGSFDIKVSHFLSGVILSNGPQVDPGYRGDLFCMLFNGNSEPRSIRLGDHFATIQFFTTTRNVPRYSGPYSFQDKLRSTMPLGSASGPGGAIFGRIEAESKKLRGQQNTFQTLMFTTATLLSAVVLAIVAFAFSAVAGAFSAAQDAQRAAAQANIAIDNLKAQAERNALGEDQAAILASGGGPNSLKSGTPAPQPPRTTPATKP